ncbi:MAG: hypothetical protein H7Z12_19830 [Rhodospirillaceae bacterium]|nr:hypothetical protein [Rhodospirillales bacterium]
MAVGAGTPQELASATQITDLVVEYISVVDVPATGKTLTLKSGGKHVARTVSAISLTKQDDELQIAYGIVYPANTVDAHGHWANASTIRKAAERFMRDFMGGNIDKQHNFSKQDAYAVESWIIRKGDPMFPSEPEGSWAVGVKVLDRDLWKAIKAGDYTGFSLAGYGELEKPPTDAQQVESWLSKMAKFFEDFAKSKEEKDVAITPDEKADIAKSVIDLLKAEGVIKAAAPPVIPSAAQAAAEAPPDMAALVKSMTDMAGAMAALPTTISDTVAKAVAKGVTEGNLGGGGAPATPSFV